MWSVNHLNIAATTTNYTAWLWLTTLNHHHHHHLQPKLWRLRPTTRPRKDTHLQAVAQSPPARLVDVLILFGFFERFLFRPSRCSFPALFAAIQIFSIYLSAKYGGLKAVILCGPSKIPASAPPAPVAGDPPAPAVARITRIHHHLPQDDHHTRSTVKYGNILIW